MTSLLRYDRSNMGTLACSLSYLVRLPFSFVVLERIDFTTQDVRAPTSHGTDLVELIRDGVFADAKLHELASMKRSGRLPAHRLLFDLRLHQKACAFYAIDLATCAHWLDSRLFTLLNSFSSEDRPNP